MKKVHLKIRNLFIPLILLVLNSQLKAQTPNSVGIGTTNPDNSAVLHLESSKQGFLMTRLNTSQINAVVTPTVGLIIFNTDDQCYWYKRTNYWARLCNTDSINAQNVITNTFSADTSIVNVNNFGNGYGDSIWVHYADIDTAIIHNLTVNTINADSIFLGGNSITTVITDSIKSLAWLLKGNSGTNPTINFLGTIDNQDLVFRTNNTEKVRVTAPGNVGIGTSTPDNSALLELKGTDKGFLMTRLTTTQINSIVSPTIGLMTYNTDDNCYWYKHPYGWKRICNTDSLGNIFISTLTTNTINAQTINTNTLNTNIYNFGSGIGDSIWVHYADIDTAIIHSLTANVIHGDSIYLGGNSITTVITDSITHMAWLLLGNTGTNPAVNFLGTKDNKDLVFRTNNTEKARITNTGNLGVGVVAPTNRLEVAGNTKTTNFQMTTAPTNNFIMKSDAVGNGSWANISSVLTSTALNGSGWTILGNTGTTPAVNFLGTIDNQDLVIRTNNTEKLRVTSTGSVGVGTNAPTAKFEVIGNSKTTNFQMTSGASNSYIMQSDAVGSGSWTPLATMVATLAPSTFSSNAWTILGNGGTNPAVNFLGTTDNKDLTIKTNNTEIISVKSNVPDEVIIGKSTSNQMTLGTGLNLLGNGMRYVGFNLKRSGANFVTQPFNFGNGSSFIYTANDGEIGIGSTQSTGTSPNTFTDAQLTNNIRWRYTVLNQFLSVATPTNANYNPTVGGGPYPQITATGNNGSGLIISDFAKSVVGLQNINNIYLSNDENKNTIYHTSNTGSIYGFETPLSNTTSFGNHIFNTASLTNSNDNFNFNYNVLNGSSSNLFYTWSKASFETGFNSTNCDRVVGFGVFNNLSNISESFIYGSSNTLTGVTPAADKNYYVFGSNNTITQPSGMAVGYNNRVNHMGASCYGSNASSFSPNGVTIGAQGGMRIYSNNINSTGVSLAVGGGAWASISDKRLKENITEISNKKILDKIMSIPVTEWTYLSQKVDTMNKYAPAGLHYDKAPIHIGPMAQDFSEVFGYGEFTDKITTSDIDGVMFSGIQALAEENKELKAKIEKLEQTIGEIEELKKLINELKNR